MRGAVLLDAVGTLIELREPVGETYARMAAEHGVALPPWRLEDAFQRVRRRAEPMCFPEIEDHAVPDRERQWWRSLVRATFLAADSTVRFADFEAFFQSLFRHYWGPGAWRLRPHAGDALVELRRRDRRIGIASNFDHRLPEILEMLGIASEIDSITIPSRCRALKPDPRFFAAALADLGCAAEAATFVGDDPERDLAGARNAGLRVLDVRELGEAGLAALPARVEAIAKLADPH